jgi:hypothetical protein
MKLKHSAVILIGLIASGCATSAETAKRTFAPDSSAIAFKIENDGKRCFVTNAVFLNQDTMKTYNASYTATHTFKSFTAPYDLVQVIPGNYKLMSVNCEITTTNGQYQQSYAAPVRGVSSAMSSFRVETGEIVYPGSIHVKKVGDKGTNYEAEFIDMGDEVQSALVKDGLDAYFVSRLAN